MKIISVAVEIKKYQILLFPDINNADLILELTDYYTNLSEKAKENTVEVKEIFYKLTGTSFLLYIYMENDIIFVVAVNKETPEYVCLNMLNNLSHIINSEMKEEEIKNTLIKIINHTKEEHSEVKKEIKNTQKLINKASKVDLDDDIRDLQKRTKKIANSIVIKKIKPPPKKKCCLML